MGVFYDKILRMRKNGRSLTEKPIKSAPKTTVSKKETAVKKDDKRAARKS